MLCGALRFGMFMDPRTQALWLFLDALSLTSLEPSVGFRFASVFCRGRLEFQR